MKPQVELQCITLILWGCSDLYEGLRLYTQSSFLLTPVVSFKELQFENPCAGAGIATVAIFFFFFFLTLKKNLFVCLGCVGSLLLHGLSLAVVSGCYSSLWCTGFSLWWLLLVQSTGSRCMGFSSCGSRALEALAQQLWRTGLVALWHVGSFRTRGQTHVPCIGALAGRFLTTVPPGRSPSSFFSVCVSQEKLQVLSVDLIYPIFIHSFNNPG